MRVADGSWRALAALTAHRRLGNWRLPVLWREMVAGTRTKPGVVPLLEGS